MLVFLGNVCRAGDVPVVGVGNLEPLLPEDGEGLLSLKEAVDVDVSEEVLRLVAVLFEDADHVAEDPVTVAVQLVGLDREQFAGLSDQLYFIIAQPAGQLEGAAVEFEGIVLEERRQDAFEADE